MQYLQSRQTSSLQIIIEPSVDEVCRDLAARSEGRTPAHLLQVITEGWIAAVRNQLSGLLPGGLDLDELELVLRVDVSMFKV